MILHSVELSGAYLENDNEILILTEMWLFYKQTEERKEDVGKDPKLCSPIVSLLLDWGL